MIAHLILMNLHDPSDAPLVSAQVRSLAGAVPGLDRVDGGPAVIAGPTSWDLGFVMVFRTPDAVETYQSHPQHVKVAAVIRSRIREMGTCDITLDPASLS